MLIDWNWIGCSQSDPTYTAYPHNSALIERLNLRKTPTEQIMVLIPHHLRILLLVLKQNLPCQRRIVVSPRSNSVLLMHLWKLLQCVGLTVWVQVTATSLVYLLLALKVLLLTMRSCKRWLLGCRDERRAQLRSVVWRQKSRWLVLMINRSRSARLLLWLQISAIIHDVIGVVCWLLMRLLQVSVEEGWLDRVCVLLVAIGRARILLIVLNLLFYFRLRGSVMWSILRLWLKLKLILKVLLL